jgi:hypothetical protein
LSRRDDDLPASAAVAAVLDVNGFVNETRRNGLGGVERCVMAETGGWR